MDELSGWEAIEASYTVRRDRGVLIPIVTLRMGGEVDRYEARPCLTRWGANRVGRREVARIHAEQQRDRALLAEMLAEGRTTNG